MILEKVLLGFTLAAPIGPVSVEMIKRGLIGGFWPSFNIRLGGVIGNILCLILAYFFLSSIMKYQMLFNIISLCGSSFLVYIGAKALLGANKKVSISSGEGSNGSLFETLTLGFILSIANPIAIVYWINVFAASLNGKTELSLYDLFQNGGIILGVVIWGAFLSLVLEFGQKFVNETWIKRVTILSGTVLVYFGAKYLTNAITAIFY